MSSTTLTFHFIRDRAESKDDCVKIGKGDNEYTLNVSMYDAIVNKKYITQISKKNLHKYVNSLLTLTGYDSDPFVEVQVSAPFYPCFIFKTKDLTRSSLLRSHIDTLLQMCIDIWYPIDDEEEDEEDEEEEEEDDDDTRPCNDCYCSHE
jgi:hypothetical protein